MSDSYKELIKGNPDETEIRSFLVNGNQVSVTLRIPDTLRDAAKEEAADAADADAVRLRVYELDGESLDPDHAHAPFFASSSIMHVRTKAEKLMPRRAASRL